MAKPSNIFTGFRALGFVSNHVPLCVRYNHRHKENYVVTCVGKAFHVFNCSKLGLMSVSDTVPEPITCIAVDNVHVYLAYGQTIQAFAKDKKAKFTYEGHENDVHILVPFGFHLISVDVRSSVKIWNIVTAEIFLEIDFDNVSFDITAVVHPNTYLNKVLFGSRQGSLQLWNIKTNKLLYTFNGWKSSVLVLEQAPAVDVIAVGLTDGRIMMHNIKFDETIMTLTQEWGPVTAISFRTDGHPVMVTGSTVGHIAMWNLEEKRLLSQMRDCHQGTVSAIKCLPSEPLMVTSSPDNSLKVWIFDMADGGGRLLRRREGHSAPPTKASYYGNQGDNILTAGQDSRLHSFSTIHESNNKCLGRASYNKQKSKKLGLKHDYLKMSAITTFAAEPSRHSDWDSIATLHRSSVLTMTWNYQKSTMGEHKLVHERFYKEPYLQAVAQCVDISSCGNFVVIGYSTGHIDKYNMESGLHRQSYGNPTAHKRCVRGVAIDGLNQLVVSGGADSCVKFWKFKSPELLDTVELDVQVSQILLHRESAMLAASCDDFRVFIIDIDTKRIVRKFLGHSSSITDMAFSADSRWLVTASMDSTVRTWDLPTGCLVDCFQVDNAVTSVDLSPTSDFLVTTHVDDLGVYLWSNMTLYSHVNLRPLPNDYEPSVLPMPSSGALSEEVRDDEEDIEAYKMAAFKSPEQISDELVTLSLLPNSRWLSLINLDVIKLRNKPKKPPKVPKAAPFFLPTIAGLIPKFDVQEEKETEVSSKVLIDQLGSLSKVGRMLKAATSYPDFETVLEELKELGPSAVDAELRMLAPEGGGTIELMCQFLTMINQALATNKDYELLQAYLGLFLKLHTDAISQNPALVELCKDIQAAQQQKWTEIQTLFNQSTCLVSYLKSAAL